MPGRHGTELGNRHLVVRKNLAQPRLALNVEPVNLVDQQNDRVIRADRGQQRPAEQELLTEDTGGGQALGRRVLMQLKLQQLAPVIPFVDRLRLIQPLVALQADQPLPGRERGALGQLGLPGPCRSLDQHGLAQLGSEVDNGARRGVREITRAAQALEHTVNGTEIFRHALSIARWSNSWRIVVITTCHIDAHSDWPRTAVVKLDGARPDRYECHPSRRLMGRIAQRASTWTRNPGLVGRHESASCSTGNRDLRGYRSDICYPGASAAADRHLHRAARTDGNRTPAVATLG